MLPFANLSFKGAFTTNFDFAFFKYNQIKHNHAFYNLSKTDLKIKNKKNLVGLQLIEYKTA
jgi:hypothetical protein